MEAFNWLLSICFWLLRFRITCLTSNKMFKDRQWLSRNSWSFYGLNIHGYKVTRLTDKHTWPTSIRSAHTTRILCILWWPKSAKYSWKRGLALVITVWFGKGYEYVCPLQPGQVLLFSWIPGICSTQHYMMGFRTMSISFQCLISCSYISYHAACTQSLPRKKYYMTWLW